MDMTHSPHAHIPKVNPDHLCDARKLCSVREREGIYMVAVKYLDGKVEEIPLKEIVDADTYKWFPIVRTYSSWCVFINEDKTKVYLVTVEKNGKLQHQFTWWSPLEEDFSNIIFKKEGHLKVDLYKIEDNAVQRTKNRTWAEPTEFYNNKPLIDWVMQEHKDEEGNMYWRIVLLMHFVIKAYEGTLGFNTGVENIIDGRWHIIEELPNTPHVAANAYIVTKKALELIK